MIFWRAQAWDSPEKSSTTEIHGLNRPVYAKRCRNHVPPVWLKPEVRPKHRSHCQPACGTLLRRKLNLSAWLTRRRPKALKTLLNPGYTLVSKTKLSCCTTHPDRISRSREREVVSPCVHFDCGFSNVCLIYF